MAGQDEYMRGFDEFVARVRKRLEDGHTEYGGASFRRAPSEIRGEIQEELLDVFAWGFIHDRLIASEDSKRGACKRCDRMEVDDG